MKRRTLDIITSIGGLGLALVLLMAGLVLASNANFAKTYVKDQLGQQKIQFKTVATLTDEEKKAPCLTAFAGQNLTSGKQAECYANSFIALHVATATKGQTYAELGVPQGVARTALADATKADPNAANLPDLTKALADITATRETAFKGETLRGLLLTSYGFSELGRKADQATGVAYLGAALMLLLALAGFAHAFRTSKEVAFATPEQHKSAIKV
ncbi:MAG: hypothetical protein ABI912_06975 [Actinomycetota bacterium]